MDRMLGNYQSFNLIIFHFEYGLFKKERDGLLNTDT